MDLYDLCIFKVSSLPLQWCHNARDGVWNIRRFDCLLNRWFGRRSTKISNLRAAGLCKGNPSVTGGFLSQRASDAQSVSIWWRFHTFHDCSSIIAAQPQHAPTCLFLGTFSSSFPDQLAIKNDYCNFNGRRYTAKYIINIPCFVYITDVNWFIQLIKPCSPGPYFWHWGNRNNVLAQEM